MDWVNTKELLLEAGKKYRYILLLLLSGIMLMLFSIPDTSSQPATEVTVQQRRNLEDALSEMLSRLYGAGEVEVLLTQACGEETIYQTDGNQSREDFRTDTVIVTNQDRKETGLVKQVNAPIYLGAIVLCQGADSPQVKLSIVEAVSSATGLTSDRITVLKMK